MKSHVSLSSKTSFSRLVVEAYALLAQSSVRPFNNRAWAELLKGVLPMQIASITFPHLVVESPFGYFPQLI